MQIAHGPKDRTDFGHDQYSDSAANTKTYPGCETDCAIAGAARKSGPRGENCDADENLRHPDNLSLVSGADHCTSALCAGAAASAATGKESQSGASEAFEARSRRSHQVRLGLRVH